MIYREYIPCMALRDSDKCFWVLEGVAAEGSVDGTSAEERIPPDGCMELIVHFGDSFRHVNGSGQLSEQRKSVLAGQIRRSIVLLPTGTIGMVGVRFRPNGAGRFFRFPLNEIRDRIIGLDLLWGSNACLLEERIAEAGDNRRRVALLEKVLLQTAGDEMSGKGMMEESVRQIISNRGGISVRSVAERLGISERQLERRFGSAVGLSPKQFARIIRFQYSLSLARNGISRTLTELACDAGYFDQSHFIRDYKEFTGVSPAVYFREENMMAELML